MPAVPHDLAQWIDEILGADAIEIDRAAAALLRVCRDHAAALREARSAGVDRALAEAGATLAGWIGDHVAGEWLWPEAFAVAVVGVWRVAHAELGGVAARVAAARAIAEALDDAVGHRYAALFRKRRRWQIDPGEPFPVVQPDLRRLFAGALITLPDRRETPIDRTRRLALAPAVNDGVGLALDLAGEVMAAPPAPGAELAAALPIASPSRQLRWHQRLDPRPAFGDVQPVAPGELATEVERLAADAAARGVAVLVFPELSVDDHALGRLRGALAAAASRPLLVVAGSRHAEVDGVRRNVATLLAPYAEATHAKFNPFFAGELVEDVAIAPAEVRAHATCDAWGRLGFSVVVLVCKDFLAPGAQHALEALRASLVVVPAWSEKTAVFESDARGLSGKTQSIVVVVNQAEPRDGGGGGDGDDDPVVLLVARPTLQVPTIVRRSEVAPPCLVTAKFAE
ncbi:MAG: hypothetical protein H6709_05790 [Kofleriaceae bacterium]|nr:hypothetical protein [Kofleriaceae bacterium]MCB9571584.1 hypothetical protein [Kofleriaceae bacterium]